MANKKKKNTAPSHPLQSLASVGGSDGRDHISPREPKPSAALDLKRYGPVISSVVFAVFAAVLLALGYPDYMRKVEALSLWLPTSMYYDQCMTVPGGLLAWASAYLTHFMYYPWAAAIIFASLLALIQCMAVRAFSLSGMWRYCAVALPAVALLCFTNLGYLIFTLRPQGYAFSLVLGIVLILGVVMIYKLIRWWWLRCIVLLLIAGVGYHYFGFYALMAAVICVLVSLDQKISLWQKVVVMLVGLAVIAGVPQLWYAYIGGNLMHSQIYVSALPMFYSTDSEMWMLYGLAMLILIVMACPKGASMHQRSSRMRHRWVSLIPVVTAIICVTFLRNTDDNLRSALALDRALWDQQWEQAAEIAEKMPAHPTRLNTVLAQIALLRSGQAADRLFALPYGWEPYLTSRDARPIHDAGGALIAYHLGLVNYAYRWAMEYSIAQNMSAERLKVLAKCALLNREPNLAKTYLDILYNLPNHRSWAQKYLKYVSQPMAMLSDPEMVAVSRLMCHPNQFVNDGGAYESYIWPLLASAAEGTPEFNDLSMLSALIVRDLDAFMAKLPLCRAPRLPRYYQEAALLWSLLGNQMCPVAIDPMIEAHHQRFLEAFRRSSSLDAEQQKTMMEAEFGDTYWFYYVFTANQPMI